MDGWSWNTSFLLGWPVFRDYVSFREGIELMHPCRTEFLHLIELMTWIGYGCYRPPWDVYFFWNCGGEMNYFARNISGKFPSCQWLLEKCICRDFFQGLIDIFLRSSIIRLSSKCHVHLLSVEVKPLQTYVQQGGDLNPGSDHQS